MPGAHSCRKENVLRNGIAQAGNELVLRQKTFCSRCGSGQTMINEVVEIVERELLVQRCRPHPLDVLPLELFPTFVQFHRSPHLSGCRKGRAITKVNEQMVFGG